LGDIYTIAGSGTGTGSYNGDGIPATSAELAGPVGVAADATRNLLIADEFNNRVRIVAVSASNPGYPLGGCGTCTWTDGNIYTIAGDGSAGYYGNGISATSAQLNAPQSVAVDGYGDVFIGDLGNFRVREIVDMNTPTITTTLSGARKTGATISVRLGTAVSDQASLSGATPNAGGTVTYSVYSDSSCSTSVGSGGTVSVTDGVVPPSNPITLTSAGPYYWQASYSGDDHNSQSNSPCGSEVESVGFCITTTSVPDGTRGIPYGPLRLEATAGFVPYKWELAPGSGKLPRGMRLISSGLLGGTPSPWDAPTSYSFVVRCSSHRPMGHPIQAFVLTIK
jgi:hypothetical protein